MLEFQFRDALEEDFSAIKRLNDKFVHFTSPMDLPRIQQLDELSCYHRVIEQHDHQTSTTSIVGFLLAMAPEADYASENYQWFDQRYKNFVYVDRIVVDSSLQGRGLGKDLYNDLFRAAKEQGFSSICCEYNLKPVNFASAHFHHSFGFCQVGSLQSEDGSKVVSMQMAELTS
ncbi:GNAT family N-acetyltransferase [Aliiglaciecola sp. 3_MG-2023]|uniref:GNAT family N-acetyltransferase n=1 Tax=Aliiglaciecola sp. 3_MG-2023 TaxID=3062644 RepID=UPI0026E2AA00|nr:GNAT family N-acetyltransferase [Aliiglaciecola sp. 3_MG-2023]MDO6694875.1 GNAT family N-acetyltransferase [Aliiglaciecola sp. 3_MG-2023]